MKNIWRNGMMGLVVGDALGVPVQFMERDEIKDRIAGPVTGMEAGGVYKMPKGTWSDDSSMALCTLDSILECGTLDPVEVMLKFVRWEVKGEYTPFGKAFDQGNTCSGAIYDFIQERDVETCGRTGEYANGNGALMRILPVCLYYYDRQSKITADITQEAINGLDVISGLTHNHTRSKMACGLYYFIIKEVLSGLEQDADLKQLIQNGLNKGFQFYGSNTENLKEIAFYGRLFNMDELEKVPEAEIVSSGYVVASLEAAIWCLITTDSYRECLLKAVNLGDDTDTIAAIAGGIAGLYYGYDEIPEDWLSYIKRRKWLEDMFARADENILGLKNPIADIHMHVIPKVDDGSESMDMSMEMLRDSYFQGVRKVFCTSHGGVFYADDREDAKKFYDELLTRCAEELPDLQLFFGAEVRMLPTEMDHVMSMLDDGIMPTLADTEYVLAEYVDGYLLEYEDILNSIQRLIATGYIPIVAHVERYYSVIPNIEAAKKLHDLGCYFQINAYSVVEEAEKAIRERATELLEAGLVDFIGSDAHRTYYRPPMLIRGVKELYKKYDKEYVDRMVYKNVDELILTE